MKLGAFGMRSIKRILVAVKDPDAKWSAAIAKATQLARSSGAHVELFFGVEAPRADASNVHQEGTEQSESEQSAFYTQMLERLARQVQDHGVSVSAVARVERPIHESILKRAASTRADLIVIDCHTGLHIAPSLLRLTDWELARLSPVPVLIVKRQRLYRRPKVLAAVDPTHAYSKPLDLDAEILGCGAKVCEILRGTLHAVHAYVPALFGADASTAVAAGTAMRIDAIAAADARSEFSKVLHSTFIPAERRHLICGHPADAIKQAVADTDADVVVLGSMSRSGLRRLLIGNTADKLLYRLSCDLLLIKPTGILNVVAREQRGSRLIVTPACS